MANVMRSDQLPIRRVLFLGSKRLGLRILEQMAILRPEALVGAVVLDDRSDRRTVHDEFLTLCGQRGIPMHEVARRSQVAGIISHTRPDLCIVVGWYWLFSREMLARASHGFIGIHNSLLPRYRGGAPLVWSLINGESEVGFSLFSFTAEMDAGPVWARESLPVGPDEAIGSVLSRLEDAAVATLRTSYGPLLDGELEPRQQEEALATYCCQRKPEDGQIDWSQPATSVHNFIRAQSDPYPGAFTLLDDHPMHVWSARLVPSSWCGTPGQVAQIVADEVMVVCGDARTVALRTASLDGQRKPAAQLVRSVGVRFPRHPLHGHPSLAGLAARVKLDGSGGHER